ncbi:MAG: 30S ribosomal protein S3 [Candidatus Dojkabacteria bacterium]|uniref:Small ribosomal subunit protein uS3 n=2 Tax=Candidatus Dojkabacteria TaxID=74243 RepID=A0A136KL70_9BACT|nr:MAG: 30S ribosomal protein S3 [candidate division WS6 bacterium OLB21]MBW7953589.1 30S ribosomal protein S3 [Candidatus Dojkabacteria bacterium]WKZ27864.1 MAG: 30S ribosomal protein S3 [Candidatus Dojkabacteria bacterium]
MGQKVNAHGFRLGVNKGWNSVWYAPKDQYADLLLEDVKVREFIREKLQNAGVDTVKIKRSMNRITIEVTVARPGVVIGRGGASIEDLKKKVSRMVKGDVDLKIFEAKRPETLARLIAENVKNQVARRIVPKYAMSREIENARNSGQVKGIRIWVSGRIKGAEIARTEKSQWGSIPLQTLRADIDYAFTEAQVPNAGKHGIKVWVYTGEKMGIEDSE